MSCIARLCCIVIGRLVGKICIAIQKLYCDSRDSGLLDSVVTQGHDTVLGAGWAGAGRGGKIGPTRWASPVSPKLGPGWAIKLLARKKSSQIWPGPVWPSPVWPGPARPGPARPNFFCLEKTIWPDQPGF